MKRYITANEIAQRRHYSYYGRGKELEFFPWFDSFCLSVLAAL